MINKRFILPFWIFIKRGLIIFSAKIPIRAASVSDRNRSLTVAALSGRKNDQAHKKIPGIAVLRFYSSGNEMQAIHLSGIPETPHFITRLFNFTFLDGQEK